MLRQKRFNFQNTAENFENTLLGSFLQNCLKLARLNAQKELCCDHWKLVSMEILEKLSAPLACLFVFLGKN